MKTYKESFAGEAPAVQIQESKDSDKLIDALGACINAAPERPKNKLAQVFEDYQENIPRDSSSSINGYCDTTSIG